MPTFVLVPMLVDALSVQKSVDAISAGAFDKLPYIKTDGIANQEATFLGSTVSSGTFADTTVALEPGVHLHWTLPKLFRTAVNPLGPDGQPRIDQMEFRKAPNRWLVTRTGPDNSQKTWLVKSDEVLAVSNPPIPQPGSLWPWKISRNDGVPSFELEPGTPPWRNVGNVVPNPSATDAGPPAASQPTPSDWVPCTADGWGMPTFSGYYPACRNVFGMHDEAPVTGVTYSVVGWFSRQEDDPLWSLCTAGKTAGVEDLKRLSWGLEAGKQASLTGEVRTLVTGQVSDANFLSPESAAPEFQIGIGDTGTLALATVLGHEGDTTDGAPTPEQAARAARRYDQVSAMLMAHRLHGHRVDIGRQLDTARDVMGYQTFPGGIEWFIKPAAGGDEADTPVLSEAVAKSLAGLRAAQAAYEWAGRQLEGLRSQLFADWQRAIRMSSAGLQLDEEDEAGWFHREAERGFDTNDVFAFLQNKRIPPIRQMAKNLETAANDLSKHKNAVLTALSTGSQDGLTALELAQRPAPPFYAPSDPVVALVAQQADPFDRWDETALPTTTEGALKVDVFQMIPSDDLLQKVNFGAGVLAEVGRPKAHVHLHSMCWRAEFRPVRGRDPVTQLYAPAWPPAPSEDEAVESIEGSALLVGKANTVTQSSILAYLKIRLGKPVIAKRPDGTTVSPLKAALHPDTTWKWTSPAEQYCKVKKAADLTENDIADNIQTLSDWAGKFVASERIQDAADHWNELLRPSQTEDATANQFPDWAKSGVCDAVGRVERGLALDTFWQQAGFPDDLATTLKNRVSSYSKGDLSFFALIQDDLGSALGGSILGPLFLLLQQAEVDGNFDGRPRPWCAGRASLLGLPPGGWIEAKLIQLLGGTDKSWVTGIPDEVASALTAAKPTSLLELAAVPHLTQRVVFHLFKAIPNTGAVCVPEDARDEADDPLHAALLAWQKLTRYPNVLVHTLHGFHERLLQWSPCPQLPVADPLGFEPYQSFAQDVVRPLVGSARRRAPLRHTNNSDFHPLRSGQIALKQLRLIDTFGIPRDLPISSVFAQPNRVPEDPRYHAALPPRITQPSRLDAGWLPAQLGSDSPVCGWLALDESTAGVLLYGAGGDLIGEITPDGRLEHAPTFSGADREDVIDDPTLRLVVDFLRQGAGRSASFIDAFTDRIEAALEQIHPGDTPADEALALLVSRPLAIARLKVRIELATAPARRQDDPAFHMEIGGGGVTTDGFEHVQVPVRVGLTEHLGDGTVCTWPVDVEGAIQAPIYAAEGKDTGSLAVDSRQTPLDVVVLFDPHGEVRIATKLFPVASLKVPAHAYVSVLKQMEIVTPVGPVLTAPGLREALLPTVPGWASSWMERAPTEWIEYAKEPRIDAVSLLNQFPNLRYTLWSDLVACGALTPLPGVPGRAAVSAKLSESLQSGSEDIKTNARSIALTIARLAYRTEQPTHGLPHARCDLRMGILRIIRTLPTPEKPL